MEFLNVIAHVDFWMMVLETIGKCIINENGA